MATLRAVPELETLCVVHPLKDEAEKKCSTEGLAPMAMTRSVRGSLMVLRGYLLVMTLLLVYRVLDMAGVFRRIH